ncbi:MAG: nucleotidyltransferase family protein [Christensenellales bacterium]
MKAIVLAAGYAMRLYPLTKDMPKALLEIGGQKMLDYLTDQIAAIAGIDEIVIVTNSRFADQFRAWADQKAYPGVGIRVLDDGTRDNEGRLGAIGDMQFAIENAGIDDDVLVAASDNLFTFSLHDFVADFQRHGRDTILVQRMDDVDELRRFAIATLDDAGRVISLVEKPEHPPADLAVYALYLYRRDTLPLIKQYLDEGNDPDAPGHFPEWLYQRREVRAYAFEGECVDIGTVDAYRAACERFQK